VPYTFNRLSSLFLFLPLYFFAMNSNANDLRLLTYENPPYVYVTQASGFNRKGPSKRGMAVEVIDLMMTRANVSYQLDIVPIKRGLIMALQQENACVFPIERSQEREVQFAWISPVIISHHGFYKAKSAKAMSIRTLTDALPYNIGSFLGSGIGDYLTSHDFKVDHTSRNNANLVKLNAGRIDLWASDTLSAEYIAQEQGIELPRAELIFFTTLKAMACHRNVPEHIIRKLDFTLQSMYQDGSMERIHRIFNTKHD